MKLTRRNFLRTGVSAVTRSSGGVTGVLKTLGDAGKPNTFLVSMQRVLQLQNSVRSLSHLALWHIYGDGHEGMDDLKVIPNQNIGRHLATTQVTESYRDLSASVLSIKQEHPHRVIDAFAVLEPFARVHIFDNVFRQADSHQGRLDAIRLLLSDDAGVSSGLFLDLAIEDGHYPSTFLANWLRKTDRDAFNLFASTYGDLPEKNAFLRGFLDDFFHTDIGSNESDIELLHRWSTIFDLSSDDTKLFITQHLTQVFCYAPQLLQRLVQIGMGNPLIQLIQETSPQYGACMSACKTFKSFENMGKGLDFWNLKKGNILQRFGQLQAMAKAIQEGIETTGQVLTQNLEGQQQGLENEVDTFENGQENHHSI